MTGLLIVMQRHIIVQIIRKRVRNLANYISSGPGAGYHVHTRVLNLYRVAHMFSPSLKSICGLTGQTYSQFQILSQLYSIRAFERRT